MSLRGARQLLDRAVETVGSFCVGVMVGVSAALALSAMAQESTSVPPGGIRGVVITVVAPQEPTVCPTPPPRLLKMEDGTYQWSNRNAVYTLAIACSTPGSNHREEWTALPERGGVFIRRLP